MGLYTAHWDQYKRDSVRWLRWLLALFALGLPFTALVAVGMERWTGTYPVVLHLSLLVAWLVAFTWLLVRSSRVGCPRCGARYSRGKWLSNCPQCDLRMLQEEP